MSKNASWALSSTIDAAGQADPCRIACVNTVIKWFERGGVRLFWCLRSGNARPEPFFVVDINGG